MVSRKSVLTTGRSTPLAILGQVLVAGTSVAQALVILVVAGQSPYTDAFLAVYVAYLPIGTLAATLRIASISWFEITEAPQAAELVERIIRLGYLVTAGFVLASPLLAWFLVGSSRLSLFYYATAAMLLLALGGLGQLVGAAYSGFLGARDRLTAANLLYGACGLFGLVISVAAVRFVGAAGVAVGTATGGWLAVAAQQKLLQPEVRPHWRPRRVASRPQLRLLLDLLIAAAMPIAVQLHLLVSLAFVPFGEGEVTGVTYSFLFLSLVLGSSFGVVGAMGLARVEGLTGAARYSAVRTLFASGTSAGFWLGAPAVGSVLVAAPLALEQVPLEVIDPKLLGVIVDYVDIMTVVAIPWALQTLMFSSALALGRARRVLIVFPIPFVVLLAGLLLPVTGGRSGFVAALLAAEVSFTVGMAVAVFGRPAGRILLRALLTASPPLAAAGACVLVARAEPRAVALSLFLLAAMLTFGVRRNRSFDHIDTRGSVASRG